MSAARAAVCASGTASKLTAANPVGPAATKSYTPGSRSLTLKFPEAFVTASATCWLSLMMYTEVPFAAETSPSIGMTLPTRVPFLIVTLFDPTTLEATSDTVAFSRTADATSAGSWPPSNCFTTAVLGDTAAASIRFREASPLFSTTRTP